MNAELLSILLPAWCVCVLIALTHAPLGISVLQRGIIFIDLAIAQIAGLGMLIAVEWLHIDAWWLTQLLALSFACAAAAAFHWCEKYFNQYQEAVIGCSYVLAASLAVLALSHNPHGGEALNHLLAGQVLFVEFTDVLTHLPIYALILLLWFTVPVCRQGLGFYAIFAAAITSSVQLVGVYVVFASLIMSALATVFLQSYKAKLLLAWSTGILSVSFGLLLAASMDFPAGPMIVLFYGITAILALMLSKSIQS